MLSGNGLQEPPGAAFRRLTEKAASMGITPTQLAELHSAQKLRYKPKPEGNKSFSLGQNIVQNHGYSSLPPVCHTAKSLDLNPIFTEQNVFPNRSWEIECEKGQGCHATGKRGKTGNLEVHFSRQGKHREFAKKY